MLKIAAKTKEVKNCSGSNAILWSGQVSTFNESYRSGRLNIYPFLDLQQNPQRRYILKHRSKAIIPKSGAS